MTEQREHTQTENTHSSSSEHQQSWSVIFCVQMINYLL